MTCATAKLGRSGIATCSASALPPFWSGLAATMKGVPKVAIGERYKHHFQTTVHCANEHEGMPPAAPLCFGSPLAGCMKRHATSCQNLGALLTVLPSETGHVKQQTNDMPVDLEQDADGDQTSNLPSKMFRPSGCGRFLSLRCRAMESSVDAGGTPVYERMTPAGTGSGHGSPTGHAPCRTY